MLDREETSIERLLALRVETLREKGITHEEVLNAIGAIPRHEFIPDTALLPLGV